MMYTRTQERVYIYVVYQDIVDKLSAISTSFSIQQISTLQTAYNVSLLQYRAAQWAYFFFIESPSILKYVHVTGCLCTFEPAKYIVQKGLPAQAVSLVFFSSTAQKEHTRNQSRSTDPELPFDRYSFHVYIYIQTYSQTYPIAS